MTEAEQAMIENSIALIEKASAVEVVLTLRVQSSRYRDASFIIGFILSLLLLAFLLYTPTEYPISHFFLPLTLIFFIGAFLVDRLQIGALFVTHKRKVFEAKKLSAFLFHETVFNRTKSQTGLLIFLSQREKIVILSGEQKILKHWPSDRMEYYQHQIKTALQKPQSFERFAEILGTMGVELAEILPAEDQVNEIENRPQITPHRDEV